MLAQYITALNHQYQTGNATEHSYRPALQELLESLIKAENPKDIQITNEPKRIDCGAPDYIVAKKGIPVGYIEAKNIGKDLNDKEYKEQFNRYKRSLNNLIITDYLNFELYEKGEFKDGVRIAELKGGKVVPLKDNFEKFESLIEHFGNARLEKIVSSAKLAEFMAGKARLMAEVIEKALAKDSEDSALAGQMAAFKEVLIHDIAPKEFADVYAQTIAYGMFAARLRDDEPDNFSRDKAAKLIPKTNPFLRQFFQNIAGYDLDERIVWIVDDLAETFRATDMQAVMKEFGKHTQRTDPIIHFYENFLSAYDPALRKSKGVWCTPQAVVNFIVRAVDEILKNNFNLPQGLADPSKIILDPATGTGTFLAETVNKIYETFRNQKGMWQSYVEEHLIPRLNGFEFMMAPYAMAHINLDWLLSQTGYVPANNNRLRIYLTNSLEEYRKEVKEIFLQALAKESKEADRIKRDTPVMVVMGNPPYSGISKNNGEWITGLINDYKYVNGEPLNERKHWLNDDYVKFIRLGQEFVDKNNEGILAYINNHSFIDNPTFRGMRWNLMKSFDKIYIIDLHGNSKKKEVCPDGSKDENVFDIQQGVSINIFVKTGLKAEDTLAEVYHFDLYGKRKEKYDYLLNNTFSTIPFAKLEPTASFYFFIPKNEDNKSEYEKGFKIDELMSVNVMGITTARDGFIIDIDKKNLLDRIVDFSDFNNSDDEVRHKYSLKDTRGWNLSEARRIISSFNHNQLVKPINYRPFDIRNIYYHPKMVDWGREKLMRHFLDGENIGLCFIKISRDYNFSMFVTKDIIDKTILSSKDNANVFPLYLYTEHFGKTEKKANLNEKILNEISQQINAQPEPIDILDYIYATLHSPSYREKYKEFLKIDFPRVPYPENAEQFWKAAELGKKLRRLHLMEGVEPKDGLADFPNGGNDTVEKLEYKDGKVWINDKQYFDNVPTEAWEFYIGGYQPAQKWLKDRKSRKLEFDDILHYRKIVRVLWETGEAARE